MPESDSPRCAQNDQSAVIKLMIQKYSEVEWQKYSQQQTKKKSTKYKKKIITYSIHLENFRLWYDGKDRVYSE